MKKVEFLRRLGRTFFPAFGVGVGFCFVQMIVSNRPIMSAGLMLICIGMTLACANLEVWAKKQLAEELEAEIAKVTYKEAKRNRLGELYKKAG